MRTTLDQYILENSLGERTKADYRGVLKWFEDWSGGEFDAALLTDGVVNRWIASMEIRGLNPQTIRNRRVVILTIWRAAFEQGRIALLPSRVRKTRVPSRIPEAWSVDDMQRLLASARQNDCRFRDWPHFTQGQFFEAFSLTLWDTAFRLGDVLEIGRSQISGDGKIVAVQAKTDWPHVACVRPETIEAIDRLQPGCRSRIFGGVIGRRQIFRKFAEICQAAGLSGRSRFIRRGSATAVENASPGAAMNHLGHKTPGLAYKFYIDPRLLNNDNRPLPPRIA